MTYIKTLLNKATDEQWSQLGSRFVARCDAPGKPGLIVDAFNDEDIAVRQPSRNSLEISLADAQKLTPELATSIRETVEDGEPELRPRRSVGAPGWIKT